MAIYRQPMPELLRALGTPGSRAFLMGTGAHDTGSDLPPVPAVVSTLADLGRALVGNCGLAEDGLRLMVDPASPAEMGIALAEEAESAHGVLLVYYVGHGLLSPGGELYLATRMLFSLARGRYVPEWLAKLSKNGVRHLCNK